MAAPGRKVTFQMVSWAAYREGITAKQMLSCHSRQQSARKKNRGGSEIEIAH